jgi:hypothetical protein
VANEFQVVFGFFSCRIMESSNMPIPIPDNNPFERSERVGPDKRRGEVQISNPAMRIDWNFFILNG